MNKSKDMSLVSFQIAKMFGRGWTTIDSIIKRKSWKHI